jgi:hypothetical protein
MPNRGRPDAIAEHHKSFSRICAVGVAASFPIRVHSRGRFFMSGMTKKSKRFWAEIKKIRATKLCVSAVESAGGQVKYLRLLTDPDAKPAAADRLRKARLESLRKNIIAFVGSLSKEQKAKADALLKKGLIRKYQPQAERIIARKIKAARLQPAEVVRIQKEWRAEYREAATLRSVTDVSRYVQKRARQLAGAQTGPAVLYMGKSGSTRTSNLACVFCVLILYLTSILVVLMVLAALISIISPLTAQEIFDNMLEETCGC